MDIETKSLFFFVRSYCVCTPQGFVTKCFLIFIVDEVKNFTTNNINSSCWSQLHIEIRAKGLVIDWRFVHQRKEGYYKIKSNWVWSECSIVSWYFGIGQGSGKILYTCNRLIVDQWILESGDLKITRLGFCIKRGFPHLSTNYHVNLISAAFSLFGDLLVSS